MRCWNLSQTTHWDQYKVSLHTCQVTVLPYLQPACTHDEIILSCQLVSKKQSLFLQNWTCHWTFLLSLLTNYMNNASLCFFIFSSRVCAPVSIYVILKFFACWLKFNGTLNYWDCTVFEIIYIWQLQNIFERTPHPTLKILF